MLLPSHNVLCTELNFKLIKRQLVGKLKSCASISLSQYKYLQLYSFRCKNLLFVHAYNSPSIWAFSHLYVGSNSLFWPISYLIIVDSGLFRENLHRLSYLYTTLLFKFLTSFYTIYYCSTATTICLTMLNSLRL